MYYNIYNDKDNESYCRVFESKNECYHWIVNHLDLSKNWNMDFKAPRFVTITEPVRKVNK